MQRGVRTPRAAGQQNALALARGVEPHALMHAHNLICFLLDQQSRPGPQVRLHKLRKANAAKEADALAVWAFPVGQLHCCCQAPHLCLQDSMTTWLGCRVCFS